MKGKRTKQVAAAVATVAVVALVLLLFIAPAIDVSDILAFTPKSLILAALVLIGVHCLRNVLMFIPTLVLYIASGVLFPTGWAVAVTLVGLAAELTIGYVAGRYIGKSRVDALIDKRPRAGEFLMLVNRNDKTACFLARLIPIPVPMALVSMFFGASGVAYPVYLLFSLLGLSSTMVPYVIAGRAIENPLSKEFLIPFSISLIVTGGVFILHMLISKRNKKRSDANETEN